MSDASYARRYRMTKTDEFSSVFAFRKAFRSTHFLLHWRPRTADSGQEPRLGLVVAKKLLPRAVDRNLVRRLVRECFRLMRQRLPARDMVVRLASRPDNLDRRMLYDEISSLLEKQIKPLK